MTSSCEENCHGMISPNATDLNQIIEYFTYFTCTCISSADEEAGDKDKYDQQYGSCDTSANYMVIICVLLCKENADQRTACDYNYKNLEYMKSIPLIMTEECKLVLSSTEYKNYV